MSNTHIQYFASLNGGDHIELNAKTLQGAKAEATKIFGGGFRGHRYFLYSYNEDEFSRELLCWAEIGRKGWTPAQ